MDWAGWALFGIIASAALTTVMLGAQMLGFTRFDLPLVLGALFTADPDRARVVGFVMHLALGQAFALGYAVAFALLDRAGWWLGGVFGLVHGAVAMTAMVPVLAGVHPRMATLRAGPKATVALEPPGLGGINYGIRTPIVALAAHVAFGIALGLLIRPT